jgi:hypothetical protein
MKIKRRLLDTNESLVLTKTPGGIVLLYPEDLKAQQRVNPELSPILSIEDAMKLPLNFYMMTGKFLCNLNEACWSSNGWLSKKDATNHPVTAVTPNLADAEKILTNNAKVTTSQRNQFFAEYVLFKNEMPLHALSLKMPWVSHDGKVIGVIGCSLSIADNSPLALTKEIIKLTNLVFGDAGSLGNVEGKAGVN